MFFSFRLNSPYWSLIGGSVSDTKRAQRETHLTISATGGKARDPPVLKNIAVNDSARAVPTLRRRKQYGECSEMPCFQNCLQWGRSSLVDAAGSPNICLLSRDFEDILSVFPRKKKQNTELTKFSSVRPPTFTKPDFSGLAPIRRVLMFFQE